MKLKRILLLILCASLLLFFVAGCADPEPDDPDMDLYDSLEDDEPDELEDDGFGDFLDLFDPFPSGGIDFDAAIAAFPPDTVMIRAGDLTFSWAEFYVFLFRAVQDVAQFSNMGIDWDEEFGEGITIADLVLTFSTEEAVTFMLFEYGATVLDLSMSDEAMLEHAEFMDDMIELYGGREELSLLLRESNGFYDLDVFERLLLIEFTRDLVLVELYGENGDLLEEELITEYADRNEFIMAKHILILSAENESALEEAEDILKQLNNKINDNDFEEFFDSLMLEFSEDPGKESNPEGYLFQFEDMVTPFSTASAALEIGELSDIVETDFGYHIILRIPIDFDSIPSSAARTGVVRTLRQVAAIDNFDTIMHEWRVELNPVFTREYDSIDLPTIFQWVAD